MKSEFSLKIIYKIERYILFTFFYSAVGFWLVDKDGNPIQTKKDANPIQNEESTASKAEEANTSIKKEVKEEAEKEFVTESYNISDLFGRK